MKKNKLIHFALGLASCVAFAFGCGACEVVEFEKPVSIVSINKTASDGLQDTYTISYSNGTTSIFVVTNGKDGTDGKDGANGKDGKDGKDGLSSDQLPVSIKSIEKTGENGLVDIYTITLTDGTSTTFEITNGKDGKDNTEKPVGIESIEKTGENGLVDTYTIWYTNGTSTTFDVTNGKDGQTSTVTGGTQAYVGVAKVLQSVGKVFAEYTEYDTDTTEPTDTKVVGYTGGCVYYRADTEYAYFLTNYHVVYNEKAVDAKISEKIHLSLYGSESFPSKKKDGNGKEYIEYGDYAIACEFVGGAITYDIAMFRAKLSDVYAINPNATPVTFADGYSVGETAIAIGNPKSKGMSVTQGIVCVDSEKISLSIDDTSRTYRSIRVDSAVYQGNSGGGLFNADGELIGIVNAAMKEVENINYAIPLSIVKGVVKNIDTHLSDGDENTLGVYHAKLGLKTLAQNARYAYDATSGTGSIVEDTVITEVLAGSIAQRLGLQANDKVKSVTLNGEEFTLTRAYQLTDMTLYFTVGAKFTISYERNGELKQTVIETIESAEAGKIE